MSMVRSTPPDQAPVPDTHGTVRDGDGTERRYTTVSWNPFRHGSSAKTPKDQQEDDTSAKTDRGYNVAITLAFIGIIAVTAITMYVSYEAQLIYTDMIKGEGQAGETSLAVQLAAAAWDVAAASFAILALATAMRGDNAFRARVANLGCAVASVLMNGARIDVPADSGLLVWTGHILVWMGPSLLYVIGTDMIVWEIQRRAMERRGKPLEQASIWSVIAVLIQVLIGVLLWFVRLLFSPWKTFTLFRQWFLAEVAYAPGRTLESDKAREALAEATKAKAVVAEIESRSAAAITEAESDYARRANEAEERASAEVARVRSEEKARAEEAIRKERQRATNAITAERDRANTAISEQASRVEELERGHGQDREGLKAQYDQALTQLRSEYDQKVHALESAVTGHQRDQERLRSELERVRASATQGEQYGRELESVRSTLAQEQQMRQRSEQRVSELSTEHQELFDRLSGNAQVQHLYGRLARRGDPRYGNPDFFTELGQEFVERHGVALTPAKVAHYIRTFVSESGLTGTGATAGSDDSMGGAL
ncbi:hypothetical protein [Nocardiopsis sp. JB363]|uniref:hypothetical protein n=1 Tax=Nocardiopsis sp. JB363 TaxID=1434837 RepID=UPI001180D0F0|nr:hypothetical protein [Nocardiopsis sp. JB363]